MTGGFINGGGEDKESGAVLVRTVLNIERDLMQYWQGTTCLFNKWWFPEPDRKTLPFCTFHITSYSETQSATKSTKRVILYEPPEEERGAAADITDVFRPGVMQTIADNIVIQPKTYKMSVVVPFMPFGSFAKMGAAAVESEQIMSLFSEVLDESSQLLVAQRMEPLLAQTRSVRGALEDSVLARQESESGLTELISPERMINKNSLDAMFESGKLLAFKTWMGTECKYVVIDEVSAEKRGLEDDVWRVSLSLSEMPVLSLTPLTGKISAVADQGWTLAAINKAGAIAGLPHLGSTIPYFETLAEDAEGETDGSSTE
jgi:hypothetical protein